MKLLKPVLLLMAGIVSFFMPEPINHLFDPTNGDALLLFIMVFWPLGIGLVISGLLKLLREINEK
jgi:Flp pilus assembly protein TadB